MFDENFEQLSADELRGAILVARRQERAARRLIGYLCALREKKREPEAPRGRSDEPTYLTLHRERNADDQR